MTFSFFHPGKKTLVVVILGEKPNLGLEDMFLYEECSIFSLKKMNWPAFKGTSIDFFSSKIFCLLFFQMLWLYNLDYEVFLFYE